MERLGNAVAYPVAGRRFGVGGAGEAMVAVAIQALATFANVMGDVVDDAQSEFALEANEKVVVLHPVLLLESRHCHKSEGGSFVENRR